MGMFRGFLGEADPSRTGAAMRIRILPTLFLVVLATLTTSVPAQTAPAASPGGQDGPGNGGQGGGWQGRRGAWGGSGSEGRGILGTVTEAAADHFTVKTDLGETYTVHFSVNTRILKAPERRRGQGDSDEPRTPPQTIKPAEIKVGDAITAGGEVDASAHSIGAVMIMQIDPERAKQMREMQANFGKTWLAGRVTAIDGVKVTLQGGPGNTAHSFTADENTTFRKRRDPITLGDVQVGDNMRVEGAVKDGTFLATTVVVMGVQGPPPPAEPK
jgi:hypothetical protein